jgi:hypothetical protein
MLFIPRGQRHVCAYLDVYTALRSQTGAKELGLCRERPMLFHTKRINRSTPTESVPSSGDTSIKPIITRSFRFITEKFHICKDKTSVMKIIINFYTSNFSSFPTTSSRESIYGRTTFRKFTLQNKMQYVATRPAYFHRLLVTV